MPPGARPDAASRWSCAARRSPAVREIRRGFDITAPLARPPGMTSIRIVMEVDGAGGQFVAANC